MKSTVNRLFLALVTLCLPLLASCDTMTNTAETANATGLKGHWVLSRIKSDTNVRIPTDKGSVFSIAFSDDARASGKVACNHWNSDYSIVGNQLRIGLAATTKKLCIQQDPFLKSLERRFLSTLKDGVTFKASDIELALKVSDSETWYLISKTE